MHTQLRTRTLTHFHVSVCAHMPTRASKCVTHPLTCQKTYLKSNRNFTFLHRSYFPPPPPPLSPTLQTVAAWGPGRSQRSGEEEPARVIRALKTLIKSWKALWVKKSKDGGEGGGDPGRGERDGEDGSGRSRRREKDKHIQSVLTNLSSRLHKTERTLRTVQKVMTPKQGNTPRAGGSASASEDGMGQGRGGADKSKSWYPNEHRMRERSERQRGGGGIGGRGGGGGGGGGGFFSSDSDNTILDEEMYDVRSFLFQGSCGRIFVRCSLNRSNVLSHILFNMYRERETQIVFL